MDKYECLVCGYVYDPAAGDPDAGIEPGTAFEHQDRFTVPDCCMHSFKSENNTVTWSLVVEGDTVGWSTFRRKFPVVVYPEANGSGAG